jgi:AraC family transcriptional regulator of adaptative response/methylated-DNA-[protein]-cysteine methyltransferase
MVAAAADAGLCLLEFADGPRLDEQTRRVGARLGMRIVRGTHAHLDTVEDELNAYFAGGRRAFRVPLLLAGTPFQLAVWRRLVKIPFGRTMTYARLARALGRAGAQRAVGRANGDNPLAIVVPCHRVVGSDGTLHGYGGGLWRKRRLLELEGF